ncbi:MAG: hypothetical protein IJU76_08720 [Desulfovibrionaceae bacterium]|nr:hypothetical protein [Desulfovibrionaceae bacterium]
MRVHISDTEILQNIAPDHLLAYLRSKGACRTGEIPDKATLWQYGAEEIQVPLAMHFSDYAMRIAEALSCLEKVEGRSQLLILEDIQQSGFDIIRVRNVSEDTWQETLNLQRSVDCIKYARDLMMAAACSAVSHKRSYLGRKPQSAERFMESVLLGRMEPGCFVLQMLAPVAPKLHVQKMLLAGQDEEEPYEYRVVPTLQSGLEALNQAAQCSELDQDSRPFFDAVPQGLTSNLCDAVIGMCDSLKARSLEICISYSVNRQKSRPLARICVDSGLIPRIREASSSIRNKTNRRKGGAGVWSPPYVGSLC